MIMVHFYTQVLLLLYAQSTQKLTGKLQVETVNCLKHQRSHKSTIRYYLHYKEIYSPVGCQMLAKTQQHNKSTIKTQHF